jgi:multiple sugar transport system substrate-binding protein
VKYLASADAERILGETGTVIPAMEGLQEDWVASIPSMDLQVFIDAVDYSFPLPASPAGPEWGDKIVETLVEGWSGGIPPDEICVRADEAADAALSAG